MRAGGKATSEVLRPIADHGTHTTDQYRSFGHGQRARAAAPERASPSTHSSGRSCVKHGDGRQGALEKASTVRGGAENWSVGLATKCLVQGVL